MIGIIGAMPQEVDALKNKMHKINEIEYLGVHFTEGEINQKQVVLCLSGVGKVNATISTTLMITRYNPEYIINIGTAGGMDPEENTLDIVISEKVIQHDFDTSYIDGHEGVGITVQADRDLARKVVKAFEKSKLDAKLHYGDIISGDLFVGEESKILELMEKFPTAIACEMEAGAVSQTCKRLGTPFIIVRALSDIVHHDNSGIDFMKNVEITSERSAEMVVHLLS